MEFGRVSETELDAIDFSLPKEPTDNKLVLSGNKAKDPLVYLGCAKWGRKEWVGKIYPAKTKEADFLQHYVQHYNCIELNATHYKIYDSKAIKKWDDKASGKDFKFCPKVTNSISHYGSLKDKQFLTDAFLEGISAFGEHLGPVFFQVSDKFSPKRKDELFAYLESLPRDVQFFLEVRHPDWFSDATAKKEMFDVLRSINMGAVITDTAGRRDCCHMELSIPKAFIRYVGNSLHKTDYTRCDDWVKRMKYWLDKGLEELYFFMHMHDEATSPELTVYLVDKLNEACKLDLQKPTFVDKQQELF